MSAERDVNRIVRSWLGEDEHESADAILGLVLSRLDTTPQRRSWWPARRSHLMNSYAKLAIAAAAVLTVAVVGYRFLPGISGPGTPTAAPSPTAVAIVPTAAPSTTPAGTGPWLLTTGPLAPHDYFTRPLAAPNDDLTFTFTVPDGWDGFAPFGATLRGTGAAGPAGAGFGLGEFQRLYSDPCNSTGSGDVVIGPSVDDFVEALQGHTDYSTSAVTDVVLDGYAGKQVQIQLPAELPCDNESFFIMEGGIYAQGPANQWRLWILDVDGVRVVITVADFAVTPATIRAELLAMVESIQIAP